VQPGTAGRAKRISIWGGIDELGCRLTPYEKGPNMLNSVLESLFGCSHRTTTFPLTPTRNMAARSATATRSRQGAYVVCLDCGKEFGYDWHAMRIGDPIAAVRLPAQISLSPANRQSRASRIYS
jgi:hypothetical protein